MRVGVALFTYYSKQHIVKCLTPLLQSSLKPKILVVDSSSNDGTVELLQELEVEVIVIAQNEFNHGLTREMARKKLGKEIVVMMTPDAYLTDSDSLEKLIMPIRNGEAQMTYGRQLPKEGADLFESFPREFNYPAQSHIRSFKDRDVFGSYLYFASNSFAAYSSRALDQVGGFPKTSFGEDSLVCARLLQAGRSVGYVSEATVHHSHSFSALEEFRRHILIGKARKEQQMLFASAAPVEARGRAFAKALLKRVVKEKPFQLPTALIHLLAKWAGYRLGWRSG